MHFTFSLCGNHVRLWSLKSTTIMIGHGGYFDDIFETYKC